MTRDTILPALIAGLTIAIGSPAHAQIGDSTLPLDISALRAENLDTERRTVLIGEVDIVQGDRRLMADHVVILYTEAVNGGRGDIERIEATGNVRYFSPTQNARGDHGTYQLETETLRLTGDVVITQGEDVITTTLFVSNLETGNSSFGDGSGEDRVRVVIHPDGDQDGSDEPEGR